MALEQVCATETSEIDRALDEARQEHGAAYEAMVAGSFELMQLMELITLMASRAEAAGVGAFEMSKQCSIVIGSVCGHMVGSLEDPARSKVMDRARELMAIREKLRVANKADATGVAN